MRGSNFGISPRVALAANTEREKDDLLSHFHKQRRVCTSAGKGREDVEGWRGAWVFTYSGMCRNRSTQTSTHTRRPANPLRWSQMVGCAEFVPCRE